MEGNRVTTRYTKTFFEHSNSTYNIQRRIIDKLKIGSFIFPNVMHGILADCAYENDTVYEHIDPKWYPPRETLHCNLMLQKPIGGGIPIIEGKDIHLNEKDLLCYYVSKVRHSSSKVIGNKPRFLYTFGFCINYKKI